VCYGCWLLMYVQTKALKSENPSFLSILAKTVLFKEEEKHGILYVNCHICQCVQRQTHTHTHTHTLTLGAADVISNGFLHTWHSLLVYLHMWGEGGRDEMVCLV